jgi:phosphotransferase system enzyme I (PtsP)
MLAESDKRAELPQRALLVGDRITVFDVLVSARARPVGIALSERAAGPRTQALLELLGVPAVCDVRGLFRWASDADIALLDADHGLFVLNPSKSEIATVRKHRAERADA